MNKSISEDAIVRLVSLPTTIRGWVAVDPDGCPNVYLNARMTDNIQREAFGHEVRHVERDDLNNNMTIDQVEAD